MKKALITGVTGQDGSYLSELLIEKGYEVTGLVRRTSLPNYARISNILSCSSFNLVEGEISDAFSVYSIIENGQYDEVYNLAAQSHVATSFEQPSYTFDVNTSGPLNFLEAIRRYSPRTKFYQASTSEMFGKNYTEYYDNFDGRITYRYQDENTEFIPQSPYAIAKLASHHLVRLYRDSYNIFSCSGILFNHESPRRGEAFVTRKITKWIGEFMTWRNKFGNYVLPESEERIAGCSYDSQQTQYFPKLRLGNLDAKRDWGHAEDYVKAMWLMLQQETPDDYVIATGNTYSVKQFLNFAFKAVDIDDWQKYVVIDPEFYRPAEVDYLLGSPDKARLKLGWEPAIGLEELAKRMVENDVKEARLQRPNVQSVQACCSKKGQVYMPNV